jgi:2-C-methyl-D-erythritol 4-phosphate cytidylyltransferase
MERIGHRPLLVEGAESNIKVTTPADLALAEFILARQQSCA